LLIEGTTTKIIGAGSVHVVERSGVISMYQAGDLPLSIR
jgi:hypothetical protein